MADENSQAIKDEAKRRIHNLVEDYMEVLAKGNKDAYNEERVKIAFVLPLLEALGWNARTDAVMPEQATLTGRADFGLRYGGRTKIFLEMKRFTKNLDGYDTVKGKPRSYSEQAIQYAWGMKADWAALTNFEETRLYDSHVKKIEDGLVWKKPLRFTEYGSRFDELWLLSKYSVASGMLDAYKAKVQRPPVDEAFLEDLTKCREFLARNMNDNNPSLSNDQINESVQKILDRLIFIKNCEDRLIIPAESLWKRFRAWQETAIDPDIVTFMMDLKNLFRYFDQVYNGKLFEKHLCEDLKISNKVFEEIIDTLYGDGHHLGYNFSVIPVDVLGQAYELYIGSIIKEKEGLAKALEVVKEPSKRKEHGIYYTPEYVVDYITRSTVKEKLGECKEPNDVSGIKIADPACGSGSFLTKAYAIVREWYDNYNLQGQYGTPENTLDRHLVRIPNIEERLLSQNLYGVDLDAQAVEITILNLSLKAVRTRVKLPYIGDNVKCGNSLVHGSTDELAKYFSQPEQMRPFDWAIEFPKVCEAGGFDVVIGNPPWVSFGLRGVGKVPDELENYFRNIFPAAEYKLSVYALFLNRAIDLLKPGGRLGFILPDSFLLGRYFSKLRRYILDTSKITEIVLILEDFWRSGTIGRSVILLLEREPNKQLAESSRANKIVVKLCRTLEDLGARIFTTHSYEQQYFESTSYNRFRLFFDEPSKRLVEKLEKDSAKLSEIVSIHTGVRSKIGQQAIISQTKRGDNWFKGLISGSEMDRYVLRYAGNFINIEPKLLWSGGWDPNVVRRDKILLRQTGDSLYATLDNEKHYHLNNIHSVILKDERYDLKYVLAILNSKLMNHYYHLISLELGRALAQIDIETIEELPIRRIDFSSKREKEMQSEVVKLVDRILSLNAQRTLLLQMFGEFVKKFKQDREGYDALSRYYSKDEPTTNEYSINLPKSKEIIDYKTIGKVTDVDCVEQGNNLLLRAKLEGKSDYQDMLLIVFENEHLRKFFNLAIKTWILKSKKRYWNKEEIWELLNEIKIPKSVSLRSEDAANIGKLMEALQKAYFDEVRAKLGLTTAAINLSELEDEIERTNNLIDEEVYNLYRLTDEEKHLVLNGFGKMYGGN